MQNFSGVLGLLKAKYHPMIACHRGIEGFFFCVCVVQWRYTCECKLVLILILQGDEKKSLAKSIRGYQSLVWFATVSVIVYDSTTGAKGRTSILVTVHFHDPQAFLTSQTGLLNCDKIVQRTACTNSRIQRIMSFCPVEIWYCFCLQYCIYFGSLLLNTYIFIIIIFSWWIDTFNIIYCPLCLVRVFDLKSIMAVIKKMRQQVLARMWSKSNPHTLLEEM